MGELRDFLGVIAFLISIGSAVYVWITRPAKEVEAKVSAIKKDTDDALSEIRARVDKVEDRTSRIEGELRHLPDKGQVHRMELQLTEMRGEMKTLAERIVPIAGISERLQQFLLEQAKGA